MLAKGVQIKVRQDTNKLVLKRDGRDLHYARVLTLALHVFGGIEQDPGSGIEICSMNGRSQGFTRDRTGSNRVEVGEEESRSLFKLTGRGSSGPGTKFGGLHR